MNNQDIFQQAKKIQEALKKAQTEVANLQATGEAGAGMVKALVDGQYRVLHLDIDDDIYKEGKGVLSDLVIAAINNAIVKVQSLSQEKMKQCAMGSGLLGNFNFPFMPSGDS